MEIHHPTTPRNNTIATMELHRRREIQRVHIEIAANAAARLNGAIVCAENLNRVDEEVDSRKLME